MSKAESLGVSTYSGVVSFKIPGTHFYLSHSNVMSPTAAQYFIKPVTRSHLGGGANNPNPPANNVWLGGGPVPPGHQWRDIDAKGNLGLIHQSSEGEDQEAFYFKCTGPKTVKIRSQWSQWLGMNANGNFVLRVGEGEATEFEVV